jgi:exonuclease VII small subunit
MFVFKTPDISTQHMSPGQRAQFEAQVDGSKGLRKETLREAMASLENWVRRARDPGWVLDEDNRILAQAVACANACYCKIQLGEGVVQLAGLPYTIDGVSTP